MGSENRYDGLEDSGLDSFAINLIRRKARQLVGRAGLSEPKPEDTEQDLVIDLLRRLPRFDPTKATLHTFITRVVEHRVATIIEAQKAGLRDYRLEAGSLDERRPDADGNLDDSPPVLDQDEYRREVLASAVRDDDLHALRQDLDKVIAQLPPTLQKLCHRLQTSTVAEISRETGIPRGTLYESINKIRAHFERAGLAAYLDESRHIASAAGR